MSDYLANETVAIIEQLRRVESERDAAIEDAKVNADACAEALHQRDAARRLFVKYAWDSLSSSRQRELCQKYSWLEEVRAAKFNCEPHPYLESEETPDAGQ